MSPETLHPAPREIKFGGVEKASEIERGFAITTIRNPKVQYNFVQGEGIDADCFDSHKKVGIVIISNESKILRRYPVPVLALDGYFSPEQAANDLKQIKGYENTTPESHMQAIVFVSTEKFNTTLSMEHKHMLTHEPIESLLHNKDLRKIFFPTMCYHLTKQGGKLNNWIEFLKDYSLITPEEKSDMEGYHYAGGLTMSRLLKSDPKVLHQLSLEFDDKGFKPLILGIFE